MNERILFQSVLSEGVGAAEKTQTIVRYMSSCREKSHGLYPRRFQNQAEPCFPERSIVTVVCCCTGVETSFIYTKSC